MTSFHDRDHVLRDFPKMLEMLTLLFERYKNLNQVNGACTDLKHANATAITSIAAKFLYNLNDGTKEFVSRFNKKYKIPSGDPYIALQLRATDKQREMSQQLFAWVTNMTKVAAELNPYFLNPTQPIKHLYISTDNCTLATELVPLLPPHVIVSTPCYKYDNDPDSDIIGAFNPRLHDHKSTLRLFAEIEMLAAGTHFFGVVNSNIVRMVHRLRYPDKQNTTHALGIPVQPFRWSNLDWLES